MLASCDLLQIGMQPPHAKHHSHRHGRVVCGHTCRRWEAGDVCVLDVSASGQAALPWQAAADEDAFWDNTDPCVLSWQPAEAIMGERWSSSGGNGVLLWDEHEARAPL